MAGWVAGVVLFGVACVLAWRFLQAEELADMLRWGAASALAFAGLALIKVWFWLELQKNAISPCVGRLMHVGGARTRAEKSGVKPASQAAHY